MAYAEGTAEENRHGIHIPAIIDVKAIRTKLNMADTPKSMVVPVPPIVDRETFDAVQDL